jgi:hypothetical protein
VELKIGLDSILDRVRRIGRTEFARMSIGRPCYILFKQARRPTSEPPALRSVEQAGIDVFLLEQRILIEREKLSVKMARKSRMNSDPLRSGEYYQTFGGVSSR